MSTEPMTGLDDQTADLLADLAAFGVYSRGDLADFITKIGDGRRTEAREQGAREERERLRKAYLALPTWDKRTVPGGMHVNRAAVIAALDDPLP